MQGARDSSCPDQHHAVSIEGATVIGLIRLVATGVAIADTGVDSGSGDVAVLVVVIDAQKVLNVSQ